jgi:uncharacterized protein YfaS (alpha-2-macroglobulin family)
MYSLLALTSYSRSLAGGSRSVTVSYGGSDVITGALAGKQRLRVATVPFGSGGDVKIAPTGGEVNYNIAIRYRRKVDTLKPESHGITVTREYLDDNGAPKTTFQVGDVVVVRVETKLTGSAPHVMVSDALPAGFEALNTKLATVGAAGIKQSEDWGMYREMHDDRVDFVNEWWDWHGDHVYEYSMRAIAAGKFARPPTRAELMYEPETRAATGYDVIEIKAK